MDRNKSVYFIIYFKFLSCSFTKDIILYTRLKLKDMKLLLKNEKKYKIYIVHCESIHNFLIKLFKLIFVI